MHSVSERRASEKRTDDERNHGSSISAGRFKTLDQLLDLPDFDVLLGFTGLLLFGTHVGRGEGGLQRREIVEAFACRRLTGVKMEDPT